MSNVSAARSLDILKTRLQTLAHLLDRADAHWDETGEVPEEILAAKLAPDMLPFPYQILFACHQATMYLDWNAGLGNSAGPSAETWEGLKEQLMAMIARIGEAQAAGYVPPSQPRHIDLGPFGTLDLEPQQFVDEWVLPNLYFHLTTAYALLRAAGVPLGKADFMSHALPLLKPPAQ